LQPIELNSVQRYENYRTLGMMTFAESDQELRRYCWSRTPGEWMAALEELRVRLYGEE
jgi:hypothetical protein